MKKYTHPIIIHTLIRQKDGSSYGKYWGYLRPNLIMETSQSIKLTFNTITKSIFNNFHKNMLSNHKEFSSKIEDTIHTNKKLINLSFWTNNK